MNPGTLQQSTGFILHDVGLAIEDGRSYAEWETYGATLYRLRNLSKWALGDWINYGERSFPEWSQAIDDVQLSAGTLQNLAVTCSLYEMRDRNPHASFSHHVVVQRIPHRDRRRWLDRAVSENWSVRRLRQEVFGTVVDIRAPAPGTPRDTTPHLIVHATVSPDERATPQAIEQLFCLADILRVAGYAVIAPADPQDIDRRLRRGAYENDDVNFQRIADALAQLRAVIVHMYDPAGVYDAVRRLGETQDDRGGNFATTSTTYRTAPGNQSLTEALADVVVDAIFSNGTE